MCLARRHQEARWAKSSRSRHAARPDRRRSRPRERVLRRRSFTIAAGVFWRCRGRGNFSLFRPIAAAGSRSAVSIRGWVPTNHHGGTEIAILTRCGADERLSRCAIGWLNSGGPRTAILGAFVVAAGGRYRYWRDAIVEVAAIGGARLVRLLDGSIAIACEPEPEPLLDLFAPLKANRRRATFNRLPREMRAAILRWADPRGQFDLAQPMR